MGSQTTGFAGAACPQPGGHVRAYRRIPFVESGPRDLRQQHFFAARQHFTPQVSSGPDTARTICAEPSRAITSSRVTLVVRRRIDSVKWRINGISWLSLCTEVSRSYLIFQEPSAAFSRCAV